MSKTTKTLPAKIEIPDSLPQEIVTRVTIPPPNIVTAIFLIIGTAPYVQHAFSGRIKDKLMNDMKKGDKKKKDSKKTPKNFERDYEEALHKSLEGWYGIPATAFRNAMISACRICGYVMTRAKLSLFVECDGYDAAEPLIPLVKMLKGKPEMTTMAVRNEGGVIDIRARPMFKPGWEASVRISYDADQFDYEDVANLMLRVGKQVGVGEGRPDSKKSAGMGWGLFDLAKEAPHGKSK